MNKYQFRRLKIGDIVKINGKNIYLKVERRSTNQYDKRCAKSFRVMFKQTDEYLDVSADDVTKVRGKWIDIFDAWYNETKKYRL